MISISPYVYNVISLQNKSNHKDDKVARSFNTFILDSHIDSRNSNNINTQKNFRRCCIIELGWLTCCVIYYSLESTQCDAVVANQECGWIGILP